MRRRLPALALACVLLALVGCARPESQPATETSQQAANRILAGILREEADPQTPLPYGSNAIAGKPMAVIDGYYPALVPVGWIMRNDRNVPANRLFASMTRAKAARGFFTVPILEGGEPVSEFDMQLKSGRWTEGARLAEAEPAGYFYEVRKIERTLTAQLGPGTKTRVALFLPSGLVFVVGNNGSVELAAYLTFENAGTGIGGFDKYLPQTGDVYNADQLRGLLDPDGPSPKPVDQ